MLRGAPCFEATCSSGDRHRDWRPFFAAKKTSTASRWGVVRRLRRENGALEQRALDAERRAREAEQALQEREAHEREASRQRSSTPQALRARGFLSGGTSEPVAPLRSSGNPSRPFAIPGRRIHTASLQAGPARGRARLEWPEEALAPRPGDREAPAPGPRAELAPGATQSAQLPWMR